MFPSLHPAYIDTILEKKFQCFCTKPTLRYSCHAFVYIDFFYTEHIFISVISVLHANAYLDQDGR